MRNLARPLELHNANGQACWRQDASDLWLDANHVSPGIGYLSIMAAAYNGCHSSGEHCVIGDRPYDLRGARFSCLIGAESLRLGRDVRVLFWIQFHDRTAADGEGRYVNLGYAANPVDARLGFAPLHTRGRHEVRSSTLVPFEVVFDAARPADWVGYGSSDRKNNVHAEPGPLDHLFRRWDCNLGFHALYGDTLPDPDQDYPVGRFLITNLKLEVDEALNPG